jgi:hypothetical protein
MIASLVRSVARRDLTPGGGIPELPEDAIEDETLIKGRAATPAGLRRGREKGLNKLPLIVGEVHTASIINF